MAEDGNQDGTQQQGSEGDNLKYLRERAAKVDELEGRVAQYERERAFERAGIDPTTGPGKLLFKSYDGDVTPEAIKAAAEEYGITPPAAPTGDQKPPEGEGATGDGQQDETTDLGTGQREDLAKGAPADENQKPNPYNVAEQAAKDVFAKGGTSDAAEAAYVRSLAQSAMAGDPRVQVHTPTR